MDKHFQKQLRDYFLIFSAQQGLNEAQLEKLERSLDDFDLTNLEDVKKISEFIIEKKLIDAPEEEVAEAIRKSGLI